MRLHTSCILSASIALHAAWADTPRFDRVFGSHMVLPHGKNIPVSGTAAPNREITVTFGNTALKTKTDSKGKWSVTLPPMPPCATGQTLAAVQNGDSAKLEDVLVGEVWLASGQSNMLFRLNQTTTAKEDIAASGDDQLRLLNNVPQAHTNNAPYSAKDFDAVTTDNFYKGQWAASSPATSGPMTAVGYYFGKKLREGLGIPVGIIHSSLGGSEIAAWIPRQVINANNSFRTLRGNHWLDSPLISDWVRGRARKNICPRLNQGAPDHPYKPAFLYESGIAWTTALPITGVIWYQGESDAEIIDNAQNSMLLKTMISSWRKAFRNPEMPFVMIQLPRINDPSKIRAGWPEFREMQDAVAKTVPKVYSVNTIDLGSTNSDVHPPFKRPVGERAGNTALNKVYGKKIPCEGPALKAFKPSGSNILVQLDQAAGLTTTDGKEPAQFEIAGTDGTYHPAAAEIINRKGNTAVIRLSSPEVKSPKHARYCWNRFVTPNLVNGNQLPARPFRTDEPVLKK